MKIAVMGAGGQLGRETVESLLALHSPGDVILAVRSPRKLEDYVERGVTVRAANYDEPTSLVAAFAGVDRLLLVPTMAAPVERVRQFENALSAARAARVGHVFHYSLVSTRVDAAFAITPFLVYAESALRTSGMAYTILRNSVYADPIAEWIPAILQIGTIPYPTAGGRCGYVTRHDIGRAAAAALVSDGHEGKTYNLTGPQALTTADLCGIVSKLTGRALDDRWARDEDYVRVGDEDEDGGAAAHMLLSLYHTIRDGHMDVVSRDIKTLTGTPPERFEDFVRRTFTPTE